jgi:hypothetical protein
MVLNFSLISRTSDIGFYVGSARKDENRHFRPIHDPI